MSPFEEIERLISQDPGGRGIGPLVRSGELLSAAQSLLRAQSVLVATGFYILSRNAFETDGPPGAWSLQRALETLGISSVLVTDPEFVPVLQTHASAAVVPYSEDLLDAHSLTHLASIERAGRTVDARYYNLRGMDITPHTAPIDELFLRAKERSVETIGVGDGGNEIGMGRVVEQVYHSIPLGEQIACVVPTDHLVVAGVSNWGAWGLVAALSILARRNLLPSISEASEQLDSLVKLGVVDGKTGQGEATVDGLPADVYLAVLEELHRIVTAQIG